MVESGVGWSGAEESASAVSLLEGFVAGLAWLVGDALLALLDLLLRLRGDIWF